MSQRSHEYPGDPDRWGLPSPDRLEAARAELRDDSDDARFKLTRLVVGSIRLEVGDEFDIVVYGQHRHVMLTLLEEIHDYQGSRISLVFREVPR